MNTKLTKKRAHILSVITDSAHSLTADEIHKAANRTLQMNPSTVYRALHALLEDHFIEKQIRQDGNTYYSRISNEHKHQLICTDCHQTINIDGCPLVELEETLTSETGFKITGHHLEISGICPNCEQKDHKNEE